MATTLWLDVALRLDFNEWQSWVVLAVACAAAYFLGRYSAGRAADQPERHHTSESEQAPPLTSSLGSGEKRLKLRRAGNPVAVVISGEGPVPSGGKVLDRSEGGLRLELEQEVPIGAILNVRSCLAPADSPWIQVEVKYCRNESGFWEVGGQFLTPPDWSAVLLLG